MHRRVACCTLAALVALSALVESSAKPQQNVLQEQQTWKVVLPKGSQPEGIAAGSDQDLWVACLSGNIIRVDLTSNTSTVVYKERNVHLSGVKYCKKQQLLFVAGTLAGKAYLYHLQRTVGPGGAQYAVSKREVVELNTPGRSYINDVALSEDRAYFTDSFNPVLYWVPRFDSSAAAAASSSSSQQSGRFGIRLGGAGHEASRPVSKVSTGDFFDTKAGQFRANGIAVYKSNERKDTLVVANTHTGHLYKVVVAKEGGSDGVEAPQQEPGGAVTAPVTKPSGGPAQLSQLSQATMAVASRLRLGLLTNNSSSATSGQETDHKKDAKQGAKTAGHPKLPANAAKATAAGSKQPKGPGRLQGASGPHPGTSHPSANRPASSAGAGPAGQAPQAAGKWSRLAADVALELRNAALKQDTQQKKPTKPAVAAAKHSKPSGHNNQAGAMLSKLTKNVASHMRLAGVPNHEAVVVAGNASISTQDGAQGQPQALGFPARPSAEQLERLALMGGPNNTQQHDSSSSWQQDLLLAEPTKIHETLPDVNPAATAAAAAAAALAATTAQHARALTALGRSLLTADTAAAVSAAWPTQMARGIAGRLRFGSRQKQPAAVVQELLLPAIAGQYTQRILVDGIAIKDNVAYVADNYNNRVWGVQLDKGLSAVHVSCELQGPMMHVPTTLAFQAKRLWWVNAHLDTCFPFLPCPGHSFELHGVTPGLCQPWTGS